MLFVAVGVCIAADQTVDSRDALQRALRNARAGDVIRIAPGTYAGGLSVNNISGTQTAPIRITAADQKNPPMFEGGGNGIQFSSCSYFELGDINFKGGTGNGLNIDDGGKSDPARGIVLRNLTISDVGPDGNRDGIKLSGIDSFRVEGCRVERWGSGGSGIDMVGCHDGVIIDCTFTHDPEKSEQANGVQAKGGSARILIQHCRFLDAGGRGVNLGGSTGGQFFRPPGVDYEARELTVEDCYFRGSAAAVAFVGVDGATVRHNTIVHPQRWILRILQENQNAGIIECRNGAFSNNIIVFQSTALREAVNIGGKTQPQTFSFTGNVWFCEDRSDQTQRMIRLPSVETNGTYGVDPQVELAGDKGTLAPGSPAKASGIRRRE